MKKRSPNTSPASSISRLGEIEMSVAIGKFFDIYRRYGMRLDGRYTVLNVSMMVCEGLGKKLDPSLDITTEAKPFLEAALAQLMKSVAAPSSSASMKTIA